jgi:hypothetical protein
MPGQSVGRGVLVQETGINVRKFVVRYFPQTNERFKNMFGHTIVRSVSLIFSREIIVEGEISKLTGGIMSFTLGMALAFANSRNWFTPVGAQTILLDDATVSMGRDEWVSVSIRASSDPGV